MAKVQPQMAVGQRWQTRSLSRRNYDIIDIQDVDALMEANREGAGCEKP